MRSARNRRALALQRWGAISFAAWALSVGPLGCGRESARKQPEPAASASSTRDPALPGLVGDSALERELVALRKSKQGHHRPRTRHLREDGEPRFTNRLIRESSPYLLQHAHNPVNWYAWGDEAFERARREKKPIFLSIGYSTCHWCHVMERESFEDEEIARFINQNFVAVKVDREERPDVDAVYSKAVQLFSGRGGWPATLVLTPDKEPMLAATYLPPRDSGESRGLLSTLQDLALRYAAEPSIAVARAREISQRLVRATELAASSDVPEAVVIEAGARELARSFDPLWGGFGRAPKFPQPARHELLLRYYQRTRDAQALHVVVYSLEQMAAGAIHDQLGGGFHRYTTDARWAHPHFEKMLYDNAQLATLYARAHQLSQRAEFADVARDTVEFVLRDLKAPSGAFFAATDADSKTPSGAEEEGYYFTWTASELDAALEASEAALAKEFYGVRGSARVALSKTSGASVEPRLASVRSKLLARRALREAPHRDEKVLTSWNALMISALATVGFSLGEARYVEAGEVAASFLLEKLRDERGRLKRTPDATSTRGACLEDYAFAIQALLDLYEVTARARWLQAALDLQAHLDADYSAPDGGYYRTAQDAEALLTRDLPIDDGAEPSGNAVALSNLERLWALSDRQEFRHSSERGFRAFTAVVKRSPASVPALLSALDRHHGGAGQVLIVGGAGAELDTLLGVVRRTFVPHRVLGYAASVQAAAELSKLVPAFDGKVARGGRATAYVCERGACELPTSDAATLRKQLERVRPLSPEKPAPLLEAGGKR
jgi:uncharacterized protein